MIWTFANNNKNDQHDALLTINIGKHIGQEYVIVIDDISRMLIIQFTIQVMMFLSDPSTISLFSAEYFLLSLYIILGVCLYWLVFRKVVAFV
jgi:hypothetical protein